jgi:hypothetical protein
MKRMLVLGGICVLVLMISRAQAQDKTFDLDSDGYIQNWLVLTTIDLKADMTSHSEEVLKPVFDKEYFTGQKTAKPAENSKVTVDGKEMTWKAYTTTNGILDLERVNNSLFLGMTYIVCEQDVTNIMLTIGSDDDSAWTLNNVEVIRIYSGRGVTKDQDYSKPLTLKKGMNVLSFSVINGGAGAGACARFVDKDRNPIKNMKITLTPSSAAPAAAAPAAPAAAK